LAARILGISDEKMSQQVADHLKELESEAKAKSASLTARRNHKTGF
jgi:phosphoribosylcarboxyaminoimidazole (NCAIR) mutase